MRRRGKKMTFKRGKLTTLALLLGSFGINSGAQAAFPATADSCDLVASALGTTTGEGLYTKLKTAIDAIPTDAATNGGFGLEMWATIVDRDGFVCAVAFTGADRGAQWPASRVISAQKASTANSLSLPGLALSTANLYGSSQPGGSLWGVQFSNPVDTTNAYSGDPALYGTATDPMVGTRVGGHNVFGGGLGLYTADGIVGGLGVSGDTSCKDHNFAWYVRNNLGLDHVPAGVNSDTTRPDNIIYDMGKASQGKTKSKSQFGHVDCGLGEKTISKTLPVVSQ
jgi:uncharacterized protein GlcG (DUF336 family)